MMTARASVAEVFRREGIGRSVLYRWLRQGRIAAGEPVLSAPPCMVPVRIASPMPAEPARSSACLEVVLANGRVLRVPAGADPAFVAQMAAALER